jgi:hypothetical protein
MPCTLTPRTDILASEADPMTDIIVVMVEMMTALGKLATLKVCCFMSVLTPLVD